MSEPLKLLRRDLPLEQGRVLAFTFTVRYLVPLDDDTMHDYTLQGIEDWLAGGKGDDSERLWAGIKTHYSPDVVFDHEVTLVGTDADRFELGWEQHEREAGREDEWRSRVWLHEIPSPGASVS